MHIAVYDRVKSEKKKKEKKRMTSIKLSELHSIYPTPLGLNCCCQEKTTVFWRQRFIYPVQLKGSPSPSSCCILWALLLGLATELCFNTAVITNKFSFEIHLSWGHHFVFLKSTWQQFGMTLLGPGNLTFHGSHILTGTFFEISIFVHS